MRFQTAALALALGATIISADALAGRPRKPKPVQESERPPEAASVVIPKARTWNHPLFDELPLDLGGLPKGSANLSAQGCHACHTEAFEGWQGSAHARGPSPALLAAAAAANSPQCLSCHLPLAVQHPDSGVWDPTLGTEGVTCAACHVREGLVLTSAAPEAAPHPSRQAPELAEATACAGCHQLTWPGAEAPFYDTYGEWERSPWAAAGIQCQDCHMGPGAGRTANGSDHAFTAAPDRAVSLLVSLPGPSLVRGGDPITAGIRVQNTGAGHHVPAGSPFTGLRLEVALVHQIDGGFKTAGTPFADDLHQVVGDAAPWPILEDTRLPAGGERQWEVPLSLSQKDPSGPWWLRARLIRTVRDEPTGEVVVEQRIGLSVD